MSPKIENKKNYWLVKTTYARHYWTCRMCRTPFVLLFCRNLFLRPTSLLLDMIIIVLLIMSKSLLRFYSYGYVLLCMLDT